LGEKAYIFGELPLWYNHKKVRKMNKTRHIIAFIAILIASAAFYTHLGCGGGGGVPPIVYRPYVISTFPADDAADVSLLLTIKADFNEAMDPASINAATFTLSASDGTVVAGTITYIPSENEAEFTSDDLLDYDTTYIATVSADVTDDEGNSMENPHSWEFTTAKRQTFSVALDDDFATGGKLTYSFDDKDDFASNLAIQEDGKVVVAGYVNWSGVGTHDAKIGLIRIDESGVLDPTFDGDGELVLNCDSFYGLEWFLFVGLAIQSNGKIVVGGECDRNAVVFRLNEDGSLDNSFGVAGRVDIPKDIAGGAWAGVFSLEIQVLGIDDEKIIVGGVANGSPGFQPKWMTARLDSDGALDATFGDQPANPGVVIESWGSTYSQGTINIAFTPDASIIAYGNVLSGTPASQNFAVAKYSRDGVLDTTFGTNGLTVVDFGGADWGLGLTLSTDDTIVGGEHIDCCGATSRFAAFRLTADGAMDDSFGTGGEVVMDFGTNNIQIGNAVVSLPDGSLIVGGEVNDGGGLWDDNDFGLTMLNSDGSTQTQFGQNGYLTTDFHGMEDGLVKMQIDNLRVTPWGAVELFDLVACGSTKLAGHANRSFAVARYLSVPIEIDGE